MVLDVVGEFEGLAIDLGRDPGEDATRFDQPSMSQDFVEVRVLGTEIRQLAHHVEGVLLDQQVVLLRIARQPQQEVGSGGHTLVRPCRIEGPGNPEG